MNIRKFSLSTIFVFLSMTSLTSSVTAQPNVFEQCMYNYRRQTVKLRGQAIEKTPWYKDRRVGFDDWRDPNFYSFTVRKDHHVQNLKNQGADIRYYTNGIYYTIALEPILEVPKYSEEEMSRRCQ